MNDANKKLDKLLRQEKHKRFRLYSIIFASFVLISMGVVAYSTGETIKIKAKVTSIHSLASEDIGEHFYITVNLDSGGIIRLEIPREISVRKGDTVILNKRKTNLFGLTSHSFRKVAS